VSEGNFHLRPKRQPDRHNRSLGRALVKSIGASVGVAVHGSSPPRFPRGPLVSLVDDSPLSTLADYWPSNNSSRSGE
jgi:hypothetical protein